MLSCRNKIHRTSSLLMILLIVLGVLILYRWMMSFGTSRGSGAFEINVHKITIAIENKAYTIEGKSELEEIAKYLSQVSWRSTEDTKKIYDSCDVWMDFHNELTLVGIDLEDNVALWIRKGKKDDGFTASVTEEFVNKLFAWIEE